MKNLKKYVALLCTLALMASLAACGSGGSTSTQQESSQTADSAQQEESQSAEDSSTQQEEGQTTDAADEADSFASDRNVLVAYFSHTGNTEEVASQIAQYTGGTLAQIERETPYEDVQTEGEEELNSDARPAITFPLDNIDEYDVVFVGYPKMEQDFLSV